LICEFDQQKYLEKIYKLSQQRYDENNDVFSNNYFSDTPPDK